MGRGCLVVIVLVLAAGVGRAQNPPDLSGQLQELRRQNEHLQQELRQQQELINKLTDKVSRLEGAEEQRAADSASLKEGAGARSADRGLLGGPLKAGDVVNERVQAFLEEHQKICLAKPFTLEDFRAAVKKVSKAS